jgi:hypothetical protein
VVVTAEDRAAVMGQPMDDDVVGPYFLSRS